MLSFLRNFVKIEKYIFFIKYIEGTAVHFICFDSSKFMLKLYLENTQNFIYIVSMKTTKFEANLIQPNLT